MASQGEEVVITVDGQPKAKLTRVEAPPGTRSGKEVQSWLDELEELRQRYATGLKGSTVEQILESDRADR